MTNSSDQSIMSFGNQAFVCLLEWKLNPNIIWRWRQQNATAFVSLMEILAVLVFHPS